MNIKLLRTSQGLKILTNINRAIIPGHVTKLAESLETMGCIRPLVTTVISFIDGKTARYIVDGQHLYHALIRRQEPIFFTDIRIKNQKDLIEKIALLNASSKSWGLVDYVTAWASIKPDYKKLNHYFETYDFDITTLASVLSGAPVDGSSVTAAVKKGKFNISDEEDNRQILDYITDIFKIIPRMARDQNRYVCREFVQFHRANSAKYNHEKMINSLGKARNRKRLVLATQQQNRLVQIFKSMSQE